ncbi:hypothetical protein E1N66_22825 [Pantoea allii]|nr:hypothetical protein [Pantoea allii]THB82091.1 hypothetical protein E1N66_22825 [Pantoea allii]
MLSFDKEVLIIERLEDVKYVARLTNYDNKYMFTREFINGKRLIPNKRLMVIEIGMVDKKAEKKYFMLDTKDKTIEELNYKEIKDMVKADRAGFAVNYLGW